MPHKKTQNISSCFAYLKEFPEGNTFRMQSAQAHAIMHVVSVIKLVLLQPAHCLHSLTIIYGVPIV